MISARLKDFLINFLIAFVLAILILGLLYIFFTEKRRTYLLKYAPSLYWKIQEENKDVNLPQLSGRVIRKEGNSVLIMELAKGDARGFLVLPDTLILRFNRKLENEEISFEQIKKGNYVLINVASDGFHEDSEVIKDMLVSEEPIFSKIEKYETD